MNRKMKWIGTIVVPWVVLAVVSAIGNGMAHHVPWNESPECGADLLTLLGTSAGAGAFFAYTAFGLAPCASRKATIWLTVVLTLCVLAMIPLVYDSLGGISIARGACIIVGAWLIAANVGKDGER